MFKLKNLIILCIILVFAVSFCGAVSAHDPGPPEINFKSPKNNADVSGNVKLEVDVEYIHSVADSNGVTFTITGNDGYSKIFKDTNPAGGWICNWDTSNVPNGKYSIKVEARDSEGFLGSKTIIVNLKNSKQSSTIELSDIKGVNNQDTVITAILKDSNGKILPNKNMQFIINGQAYNTKTDYGGISKYVYKGNTGVFNITANFLGDNLYFASSKNATLNIVSSGSVVKVTSIIGDNGKNIQLKATLTGSGDSKPIQNMNVNFYVNGKQVGTAKTNGNGIAALNYKIVLNGGNYTIFATSQDNITGLATLTVAQSSIYVKVTTDKAFPTIGDTVTIFYRIINEGPNTASNTKFTYKIPNGLKYLKSSVDEGSHSYNSKTGVLTWTLSSAKIGTSLLKVMFNIKKAGRLLLQPTITTDTYDPSITTSTKKLYITVFKKADLSINKIKRVRNSYKITVKNIGETTSTKTYIKIYYKLGKKTKYKIAKVKAISPGKSATVTVKFFKYSTHRKYIKIAAVNYNKKTSETYYKNNVKKFKA
ncbi:hypothetical protein MBCUT_05010 [Methanobrevibacter cuticularis]|uniref:Bacterial Ig-like domain protein n=1 Tax=Methanobrevibacter cuticularis TaxID=47311 RepID=A0A166EPJ0_9EURY|nr:CARDB domain-containing protein [Methanobrevibacter cuticularis]KZX16871.1 hypothetical protein MBCUT_05010 [Methanobrevibacter cuticularis]